MHFLHCQLTVKNVSDGKENEGETNRKSHPAIEDEVYEEIMS